MFQKYLIDKKISRFFAIVFLLLSISGQFQIIAQKPDSSNLKPKIIKGRIFAEINSLFSGAGVGPKFETFIFESGEQDKDIAKSGKLFRVIYEYFDEKNYLDRLFFDRQIFYALKVIRKPSCDGKLSEFAYEQNGDSSPPTSILSILPGADVNLLTENQVLPCYVLNESNYKKLRK